MNVDKHGLRSVWRYPGQGMSERRRMNDAEFPLGLLITK